MIIARRCPDTLPVSILDEIECDDDRQRFRACEALSLSIWAAGFNRCRLPVERAVWLDWHAEYLAMLGKVWTRGVTPRPSGQGVYTRLTIRARP